MSNTIDVYSEITQLTAHLIGLNTQLYNPSYPATTYTTQQSNTALQSINELFHQLQLLQSHIYDNTLNSKGELPPPDDSTQSSDANQPQAVFSKTVSKQHNSMNHNNNIYNSDQSSSNDRILNNSELTGKCILYHRDPSMEVLLNKITPLQIGKEYGYRLRQLIQHNKSQLLNLSNGALHDKLYELYNAQPKYSDLDVSNIYKPNKLINRALTSEYMQYHPDTHRSMMMPDSKIQLMSIKKEKRKNENDDTDNEVNENKHTNNNDDNTMNIDEHANNHAAQTQDTFPALPALTQIQVNNT